MKYKKVTNIKPKEIIEIDKINIIDIFSKYIKILYPIIIVILGILDYFTFVEIFHFKTASFLDTYVYNISLFNSSLLLIILFLPLFLVVVFFGINFLSIYIPIFMYEKMNTSKYFFSSLIKTSEKGYKNPILLSLIFSILIIVFSLLVSLFGSNTLLNVMLLIFLILLLTNSFTISSLIQSQKRDKMFMNTYMLSSLLIFSFFIIVVIQSFDNKYIAFIITMSFLLSMSNLPFLDLFLIDKTSKRVLLNTKKQYYFAITIIFTVLLALITLFFHNINEESWIDQKKSSASISLFLNKQFKSENPINIDINISSINLNKYINKSAFDVNTSIIYFDINTTYLPISKDIKLYFKDSNKTNQTLIYAVEKKYFKGKYNYIPIDVGYIQKIK